ncbi:MULTISPECIES: type 2 periplasmic-binding domain-containing protein [Vibrio]|uniref:hypothetical protein n=1 Tax=Vibrio TaxID=662 RepID=UPI0020C76EFA|nr:MULTISPECIES: hypothetical protein [Vibrio]MCT4347676.1 hypothetical protein [Vibrio sp. NC2]MCW4438837.1 hypothetical protein [Vibrio splendidus]
MGLANLPLPVVEELLDSGLLTRVLPEWYSLQPPFYLVYAQYDFTRRNSEISSILSLCGTRQILAGLLGKDR